MSFETDLRSFLIADATVAAIAGTRVYWETRPQSSPLPAIVLNEAFGARDQTFAGPMETQYFRAQFDCMAATKSEAVALREAVLDRILRSGSAGATQFQGGFVNLTRSTSTDTTSGTVRTATIDATIWFH